MTISNLKRAVAVLAASLALGAMLPVSATEPAFHLEEATIAEIHEAMRAGRLTATQLVELYLARIAAYNGTCVREPEGLLGRIETIADAGQINALSTINLRSAARKRWGLDARKARSLTDPTDDDPAMPDAFEVAAELDRRFAETGELTGALHGIPISIKDQYDTFDMRTTSGADAPYANDRPRHDATFVARLREAGAIILAKANMGEYAGGDRSSFGGTFCNPYDTERSPGRSSGGSGSSVAANLVVCSIGEESGPSVRNPAKNNGVVGLSPTQELVSRAGMIPASFMNDRVGPMCRSVDDVARVLDVIAGYDPADELTAFSVGRLPPEPYPNYLAAADEPRPLEGMRIGVVREYMDRRLFTVADLQSIAIVERGIEDLKALGATVVDPGDGGALFQECVARYAPSTLTTLFTRQFPERFPVAANGKPGGDHLASLVELAFDPSKFPDGPTIRDLGAERTAGESRYVLEKYLKARGDANIASIDDLIEKSTFYTDVRPLSGFRDKKAALEERAEEQVLDLGNRLQTRFALQQIALQCMGSMQLDAIAYPTGNIPPPKLGAPTEPSVNGRSATAWTFLGANGFPALSVPAGFTTEVYDRVADPDATDGARLVGPVAAKLPVNIDFLARPFDEPTLFRIASAYEASSRHRAPPPGFGPLDGEP
jgi:amidase